MDILSCVLSRVAGELDAVADRLGLVAVPSLPLPGVPEGVAVAWQEIDRSQQVARALAVVVARLAGSDATGPVDIVALTEDLPLEHLRASLRGHAGDPAPSGDLDLF